MTVMAIHCVLEVDDILTGALPSSIVSDTESAVRVDTEVNTDIGITDHLPLEPHKDSLDGQLLPQPAIASGRDATGKDAVDKPTSDETRLPNSCSAEKILPGE